MEITGKVHCFFEQSGTFKNEFIKLGIPAEDYDIQNNFGETDNVIDLFAEIEKGYDNKPSIFDKIGGGDLIMAFFPCIYFCEKSQWHFSYSCSNYLKLDNVEKIERILKREDERHKFYTLLLKSVAICERRCLRMVIENPYTQPHYLQNNFVVKPSVIDKDRSRRGDAKKKPTQYFFINCKPTNGFTLQQTPKRAIKTHYDLRSSIKAGICSEERSMISPDYARNFICDFILGKEQLHTQLSLF